MTHRSRAALAVSLLLSLLALGAQALPPIDFCEENPESPLCVPVDPEPGDPFCDRFPESPVCDPVEEPPIDFCDRFPESPLCNPVEEPPVEEPPIEEPPVEEPPAPTFAHELTGSAKVKGEGFKTSQAYALQLNFDTGALTFLAMDGDGTLYGGNLVPKGTKGNKFKLFLDDASDDAFSADVAERAASASGRAAGAVLGESSKLTLKTLEDGSVALKIKSEVLVNGIGEVVFKANLTGAAPVQASASARNARPTSSAVLIGSTSFVDNWRVQR